MIPISLSIQGFLSYRSKVEIDFSTFDLACISGHNGAGKSSLLDAITWALFGQARKRDEALVNAQSNLAEVVFTFSYEKNVYRVLRMLPRGKTSVLEFQLHLPQAGDSKKAIWKPLTERSLRETQARIEEILRLDYETFINASFFLQGKADQFTQQKPGDRKRILGSILGLEIWEGYRLRAAERRKNLESDMAALDGRLEEINAELAEEAPRKARLKSLQEELARLSQARQTLEKALANLRKLLATLDEQRRFVETLMRQSETSALRLQELASRLASRRQEQQRFQALTENVAAIQAAYQAWQSLRVELARWDETAEQFREQEHLRRGPLDEINAERVRLLEEQRSLLSQQELANASAAEVQALQSQIQAAELERQVTEARLARRGKLDEQLQAARQAQAEARAENPRLKTEMDELKERIDQLQAVAGALCPLCGQPLSAEQRLHLVEELNMQGKDLGDRYRANIALARAVDEQVKDLESQVKELASAEDERLRHTQTLSRLNVRREQGEQVLANWLQLEGQRLAAISQALANEDFCAPARQLLAEIDQALMKIGYDVTAHDSARRQELEARQSEVELRETERAQAALAPLEREIGDLEVQAADLQAEAARLQDETHRATAALAAAEAQAPDLHQAELELLDAQQQENRLRLEVGASQQKVLVLDDLKARRRALESERQVLAQRVSQYKQLERAFGKDGVPALLIEQALPQIEDKANELLERLSGGTMSVRFVTQAAYKDRRRDDMKETLDIQISDGVGVRDYEMFSGGEAFRVNFAIRLALSEVLAQRAGARLQTLVIDEGFGSQDVQGRQRLIEAINLVRQDFAKILVITHIDELKDVFPTRIEVEKGDVGSFVRVV
jgi:exonuclease SbcC